MFEGPQILQMVRWGTLKHFQEQKVQYRQKRLSNTLGLQTPALWLASQNNIFPQSIPPPNLQATPFPNKAYQLKKNYHGQGHTVLEEQHARTANEELIKTW